jgi:aquaporin Z
MMQAIRLHWQEYLIEAAGLGAFMISAGVVVTLLESSVLPAQSLISDPFFRFLRIKAIRDGKIRQTSCF